MELLYLYFPHVIGSDFWIQVIVAIVCASIIGIERHRRGKTIGIRTCFIIIVGTVIYIYLGERMNGEKDSTRVLGQIVTGIGFIGAGLMMQNQGRVTGATSAAIVWMLAAIGSAIGFKYYDIAIVISFISVIVLMGVEKLEKLRLIKPTKETPNGNGN